MSAEFLTHQAITARHGFFTRRGGVSQGPYASLNCSLSAGDAPENLTENRARVAASLGLGPDRLLGLTQVHGPLVITVNDPWPMGAGAKADALVTARPDLALSVITADCAPVLFEDAAARIVGAAHAGWRGAVAGVLEASIDAMCALGATRAAIRAVIGPSIAQFSYEVGPDLRSEVLAASPDAEQFFAPGRVAERHFFDLTGYSLARLRAAGVEAHALGLDTVTDEARFFSHRRRTLRNEGPIGHQISAIASSWTVIPKPS